MKILYSMCWEDPNILIRALKINKNDKVLSIASGGENLFALALQNPKEILALDINKEQIYLVNLKIIAIRVLDFDEFIGFIGLIECSNRISLYNKLKPYLNIEERVFWRKNRNAIKYGIIHCGKFERYLYAFRRYILPLIIKKNKIREYLDISTVRYQKTFYVKEWNSWRWKILFKIFFSKTLMQVLGRKKAYFKYNLNKDIAKHYFARAEHGITRISVKNNPFTQYILLGSIQHPIDDHPYLSKINFYKLKKLVGKITLINSDIFIFLEKCEDKKFSKYNLSDIFELMSEKETELILSEMVRTSYNNGRFCYWNNLVYRKPLFINGIKIQTRLSKELHKSDRVFFYSSLAVGKINNQ